MRRSGEAVARVGRVTGVRSWSPGAGLVAVLVVVVAAVVAGAAAARSLSAPVYGVSFRATALGTAREPNIVRTKFATSGALSFDQSPLEGEPFSSAASAVTGQVVVQLDVLTPLPRTEQLTLAVTDGRSFQLSGSSAGLLYLDVKVTASTTSSHLSCAVGETGLVAVGRNSKIKRTVVEIRLPGCGIDLGQRATTAPNSRVHVSFFPHCLRTTQAVGQPLCGSPTPTTLTLTVNGKTDTATTAKPSNDDPNPLVVPYGTSLNITATANEPMPPGWKIEVHHNGDVLSSSGNYAAVCVVKTGASSCTVTRPPPTAALTGDVDDIVYAQLLAPTYLARNVQIMVNYRK